MMSHALGSITFSAADQAELAPKLGEWYRECLLQLRAADRLREAAGIPLPPEASQLYAYLLPRQAVSSR